MIQWNIVVGPTPPPKNGGVVQQQFLRIPADGIPPSNGNPGPLVDWWPPPFNQQVPTSTGAVHKSVTCSCVFKCVQLNKCVLCVVLFYKEDIVVMGV